MTGRFHPQSALTQPQRRAMLTLMRTHFVGVTEAQFTRDLDEKNWVILLEDETGQLRGFSTLHCYATRFQGEPLQIVYSGDTIVDPAARSSSTLARTWIAAVNQLQARTAAGARWYWLLITSGFRTYRFLPVFWREFWPRWDAPTPPRAQAMLEALARARFGDAYDAATGIVRFASPQILRDAIPEASPARTQDPHVTYFAKRNPGWVGGDELVCLSELSETNLTAAGRRMVGWTRNSSDAARCLVA